METVKQKVSRVTKGTVGYEPQSEGFGIKTLCLD